MKLWHQKHSCGCGHSNVEINTRIINGEEAVPFSWSMVVSIRYDLIHNGNSLMHVCGGTILTESFILTAANCLDELKGSVINANVTIAAGIHRRSQPRQIIRSVDQVIIHPNWTGSWNQYENDIALLHLSQPIDFSRNSLITRTCLPEQLSTDEELLQYPVPGLNLVVVGWGRRVFHGDDSDILQQLPVTTLNNNHTICKNMISDPLSQFCAKLHDASGSPCYGDFGGPILRWLQDRWEQVGIASFTPDGCEENSATGYTRLAYHREWIDEQIKDKDESTDYPLLTTVTDEVIPEPSSNNYQCDRNEVPCGCGRRHVQFSPSKIMNNNHEAVPYSWSMIVSIRSKNKNKHLCSGSILSEFYILTSASCIENLSTYGLMVLAGIHNRSEAAGIYRKVDRIFMHPNYAGHLDNYANDLAILHVSEPFYFESSSKLAVVGWGLMNCQNKSREQDLLQQIEVYSTDQLEKTCYILDKHQNFQFCAGLANMQGEVPCVGDPGSPVFLWLRDHWVQVGIGSYIFDYGAFRNLGIYTRTIEYNEWIQQIIGNCSSKDPLWTTTTTTPVPHTTVQPISYPCNRSATCGCGPVSVSLTPPRIVGGENALSYSWPMMVSIRFSFPARHWCGGSILSDSYILTAAHCLSLYVLNPPANITISASLTNLSDPNQILRRVDHIYIHPEYIGHQDNYRHDIAVLHLNESLAIENHSLLTRTCVHRVEPPALSKDYIKTGTPLAVIGWGRARPNSPFESTILQQVEVYAIDNDDPVCQDITNNTEIQFCAGLHRGGKDACQGDSGGPIFQWRDSYWEQVGIVSYGKGCAEPNKPGVYTRLSYYYDWISDILKNSSEHLEPKVTFETTSSTSVEFTVTANVSLNDTTTALAENKTTQFVKNIAPASRETRDVPANKFFGPGFNWWRSTTSRSTRPTSSNTPAAISSTAQTVVTSSVMPSSTTSSSSPFTTFQNEVLAQTNKYRAMHCAPNLKLNATLNSIAQAYAVKLTTLKTLTHSNNKLGENLYMTSLTSTMDVNSVKGSQPVDLWYAEVKDYNWSSPGFTSGAGHFTQLVWISSTDLGVGIACANDVRACYVVANYSPAGNVFGQFPANHQACILIILMASFLSRYLKYISFFVLIVAILYKYEIPVSPSNSKTLLIKKNSLLPYDKVQVYQLITNIDKFTGWYPNVARVEHMKATAPRAKKPEGEKYRLITKIPLIGEISSELTIQKTNRPEQFIYSVNSWLLETNFIELKSNLKNKNSTDIEWTVYTKRRSALFQYVILPFAKFYKNQLVREALFSLMIHFRNL
ncbi:unnamed protein product [Adineta ricciae]|uniref:Peptidase S1 domain-containing protein n=1 Tax=Adineta ricciae TaxID=249248 RepID=A0A813WNN3_ADIRI|nr:unnamed protein product [Adineta ricciae]